MTMTVQEFIDQEYWPTIKSTLCEKWQERTLDLLAMISSRLGTLPINDIPLQRVDLFVSQLRAQYRTPVTPNKVVVRGRHLFKSAIRWKRASENPFADIAKEREPQRAFSRPTDEQLNTLEEAANKRLRYYLVFARYTGARRSSLARLEERDIDLTTNLITFRETKNGETYSVPIHPTLRPWCEKVLTGVPTRLALPQYEDIHSISHLFSKLCKRCGVRGFRFHDYRHNVGTRLAEKGYDVKARMQVLGHKDPRMAMRYTHIASETIHRALQEAL